MVIGCAKKYGFLSAIACALLASSVVAQAPRGEVEISTQSVRAAAGQGTSPHQTASDARADEVGVRYSATPGCPSRQAFLRELRWRSNDLRVLANALLWNSAPLQVSVVIRQTRGGGYAGAAEISVQTVIRDQRKFVASTCLDVTRALALSVAFALESRELTVDEATLSELAPESSPPQPAPAPPSTLLSKPAPPSTLLSRPAPVAVPADRPPLEPTSGGSVRVDVGLAPITTNVLAGLWLAGGSLWLGARGTERFRGSAQVGLAAATSGAFDSQASTFRWLVADVQLCPHEWGTRLRLALCAHLLAGALRAEGGGVASTTTVNRSWLGLGPVVKGAFRLTDNAALLASVSANGALTKREFLFENPTQLVAGSSEVAWVFSLGFEHVIGGT